MAIIGTFGTYTAARLAIYSSQAAMQVTGNNIGNINTTGYTRQRSDQSSMYNTGIPRYQNSYNINIGYGAMVEQISQIRDPFLDIRFRNENASMGYYESMQEGLNQISNILDEVGRGGEDQFGIIEAQLGDLKNTLRDLLEHPASTTYDDLVRGSANTLCGLLNSYAKELKQVKTSEEERLSDMQTEVNSILSDIRDLNEQIRTQEIYGNNALELRDKRNVQIDKLSKYMKIQVSYSMEKINATTEVEKLTISLANTTDYNEKRALNNKPITLVDGLYSVQFTTGPDPEDTEDPSYIEDKPDYYKYFDINDTSENPEFRTLKRGQVLALNPDYDPSVTPTGQNDKKTCKYISSEIPAGVTNDIYKAAVVDSFVKDSENNQYIYTLTALTDKEGRVLNEEVTPANDGDGRKSYPIQLKDNDMFGSMQALRELLTEEGEFSSSLDVAVDPNAASKRGIPFYQHMLDSFAQKFASQMNTANTLPVDDYVKVYKLPQGVEAMVQDPAYPNDPNKKIPNTAATFENKDGSGPISAKLISVSPGQDTIITLELLQNLKATIDRAQNPATSPDIKTKTEQDIDGKNITVADNSDFDAYQNALKDYQTCLDALRDNGTLTPEYEHYDGGVLFSNNGEGDDPSHITAENIAISHSWSHGHNRVLNTLEGNTSYIDKDTGELKMHDGTTRNDNIAHIISLWDQSMNYNAKDTVHDAVYNDKEFFSGNFQDMYGKTTSSLGTDTRTVNLFYSNYNLTTMSLDNDRISVYGVDLNEEATNMMQYSQSFSAACKLLTTIDEMLDKLINGTI